MSLLKSIRLKNLRSLQDTGDIDLKPITILVGKNSVGKSTFLRTFPLLRQSCEKETRAPILWYGNFVDFGEFSTALNKTASLDSCNDYIEFSFTMDLKGIGFSYEFNLNSFEEQIENKISLKIREHNKSSYASELNLELFNNNITLHLNQNQDFESLSFNNTSFDKEYFKERGYTYHITQRKLLPLPRLLKNVKTKDKKIEYFAESDLYRDYLIESLTKLCRTNTKKDTIYHLIGTIPLESPENIFKYLSSQEMIVGLAKNIKNKGFDSLFFQEFICFFYLNLFESLDFRHKSKNVQFI